MISNFRPKFCSFGTFQVCRGLQQQAIAVKGVGDVNIPQKKSRSYTSKHNPIYGIFPGEVWLEPSCSALKLSGVIPTQGTASFKNETKVADFISRNILHELCNLVTELGWGNIFAVRERKLVKGRPDSLIVLNEKRGLVPLLPIEVKLHKNGKLDNLSVLGQISSYIHETRMHIRGPSFGIVVTEREIRFLWPSDSNKIATSPIEELLRKREASGTSFPVFAEKEMYLHASKIYSIYDREAMAVLLSLMIKVLNCYQYKTFEPMYLKIRKNKTF